MKVIFLVVFMFDVQVYVVTTLCLWVGYLLEKKPWLGLEKDLDLA